jgi:hypothetical protein
MDHLITFLRARLDDDEQVAKSAADEAGDSWDAGGAYSDAVLAKNGGVIICGPYAGGFLDDALRQHIARHDPARVLRDVEAKRRAVDLCVEWINRPVGQIDRVADDAFVEAGESLLRLLALPYADHKDYRKEWRPS